MKNMKKIFALIVAALLVMSSFAALAADPDVSDPGAPFEGDTHWDVTFKGVKDGTISVGGLSEGDIVKFYRVLAFDANANTKISTLTDESSVTDGAGGWKVIAPFESGDNKIKGSELKAILSTGITDTLAGKIAKNATGTPDYTATVASGATVATAGTTDSPVEDGLYVAIVVPADAGWMFNPIFVSSDYYSTEGGDKSSTWEADEEAMSYSNEAMAKKSPLEITKTAQEPDASEPANEKKAEDDDTYNAKAAGVGDTINYTIKTTIPEFADNYTSPVFIVSDKLSAGLTYGGNGTLNIEATLASGDTMTEDDYEISNPDGLTFKIKFKPAFLLRLSAATPITITYSATVTEDAVTNVNQEENTVTLEYSHEPSVDEEGEGKKIRDKTHHYTFTIDGNIWGDSGWETTEVVKIGLDKDGNEITQTTTLHGEQKIGALANAEFCLYTNEDCAAEHEYNKGAYAKVTASTNGGKIISDEDGRLSLIGAEEEGIPGLDAGTYWLKEIKAPDGYIKYQYPVKIEIIPTFYPEFTFTETEDGVDYQITCDDLMKSYVVKIDGAETATYTLNYPTENGVPTSDVAAENTENMKTTNGDIVIGNHGPYEKRETEPKADDGKIPNTQGVELPSTGGMGTTLFYIGGGILIALAVILLVTKRRMSGND